MPVSIGAAQYPENIIENLKKKHQVISLDAQALAKEIGNARAAASAMTAAYAAELLSDSEKNYEYGLALSMGAGGTYSAVILKKV